MKNLLLFFSTFFLMCISFLPGTAQNDHLKDVYEKNVIRPYRDYFMLGDEIINRKQASLHLMHFEESAYEYRLHKKHLTTGRILMVPAVILSIVGFARGPSHNYTELWLYMGSSISFSIASSIFSGKANTHFQNSLWAYNRDILIREY